MNFDQLLLNGQVAEALELRLETLEQQACEYRVDVDLAKGSALAVAIVSVPLSLTPIGMIGAFVGLCSYGYSVWADATRTRKIYPLPGVRLSAGELFATAVREGHDGETEENLIGEITGFLDKAEAWEYRAIAQHGNHIAPLLTACPPEHRPMAYRHLKRQIKLKGMLPAPSDFQQQVKALAAPASAIAPTITPAPTAPPSPIIGNNTRLGALDVEHQHVDEQPNPFGELETVEPVAVQQWTTPAAPTPQPIDRLVEDISLQIASSPYLLSRIFIGASRSGKSLLVANVLRHLRARYGDRLRIWLISGADRANEACYWLPCDRVSKYEFISASPHQLQKAYREWGQMLQEFSQLPADVEHPKLLVIDEASMIAITADRLGDKSAQAFWRDVSLKAAHLSSAGAASGAAIYMISPNGQADGLKLKRHELGAFNPVFTAHLDYWNETVWLAAKNNGLAPGSPPSELDEQAARSQGCDRVCGLNGRWLPYGSMAITSTQANAPAPEKAWVTHSTESIRDRLEILVEESPTLPEDAEVVHRWSQRKNQPVTARDIQRANLAQLANYSSAQIRALFLLLEQHGYGSTNGVENNLTYTPNG